MGAVEHHQSPQYGQSAHYFFDCRTHSFADDVGRHYSGIGEEGMAFVTGVIPSREASTERANGSSSFKSGAFAKGISDDPGFSGVITCSA
jgi:hypothetical protein